MEKRQIKLITTLMKERGMSIPQLAKDCDISHMTIRRILSDETYNPTIDTIKKISTALGTNEHDLMGVDSETINYKGVKGYIDYLGHISRIDSFKDLERCYMMIKADMDLPKMAKTILDEDKAIKKSLSKSVSTYCHINLFQMEHFDATKVALWDFRRSDDERDEIANNLGNMCKGYEFDMDGVHFLNSEAAYICGLFSENTKDHIEIQKELIAEPNGYSTKKVIRRKYELLGRKDWEEYNVQWMLYVVWQKCRSNRKFAEILRHIPSYFTIVENSTYHKPQKGKDTAAFWGARNYELEQKRDILERYAEMQSQGRKAKDVAQAKMKARNCINHFGTWEGVNCMGKILTMCKHCLESRTEPLIDYELLRSKHIHILGNLLIFDDEAKRKNSNAVIFDFDGTLLNTDILQQYEHLFREHKQGTDKWKQGRKEYLSHIKECTLFDGMDEVIDYIRQNKIKVAVVTANTKDRVIEAIKIHGWGDIIPNDNIIGCYASGRKRLSKEGGDPTLFIKALEVMGVSASDCVAFGNEIDDYKAAQSAGIKAYNCLWGASDKDREAMLNTKGNTLKSPTDITEVLNR